MIRGQKRSVVNKPVMASIHNRFDIEVIDAATGTVKQRAQAENVITNTFWSYFGGSSWFNGIAYGSGTGVPAPSDTQLFDRKGYASLSSSSTDNSHVRDGYISCCKKATLSETAAVGVTITEVGLTPGSSNTTPVCTHAMLQDMNGNPISILKTDTDIINLYATVFFHWDLDGYNGVEVLPYSIGNIAGGYGFSTINAVYFSKAKNSCVKLSASITPQYNANTRTFSFTFPRAGVDRINAGGFQYAICGPFIAKIDGPHRVFGESVGTGDGATVDFATKFDFPSNAMVYVDGVVVRDVIVSEEPLCRNDLGQYFVGLHDASTDDFHIPSGNNAPSELYPRYATSSFHTHGVGTFFNPYYDKYGIDSYSGYQLKSVETSNDLIHWDAVTSTTISKFRNNKYWRATSNTTSYVDHRWTSLTTNDLTGKNIHFATPPAQGAVITIDYDTPLVPKDTNHVYDFNLQVQFGAYAES